MIDIIINNISLVFIVNTCQLIYCFIVLLLFLLIIFYIVSSTIISLCIY